MEKFVFGVVQAGPNLSKFELNFLNFFSLTGGSSYRGSRGSTHGPLRSSHRIQEGLRSFHQTQNRVGDNPKQYQASKSRITATSPLFGPSSGATSAACSAALSAAALIVSAAMSAHAAAVHVAIIESVESPVKRLFCAPSYGVAVFMRRTKDRCKGGRDEVPPPCGWLSQAFFRVFLVIFCARQQSRFAFLQLGEPLRNCELAGNGFVAQPAKFNIFNAQRIGDVSRLSCLSLGLDDAGMQPVYFFRRFWLRADWRIYN